MLTDIVDDNWRKATGLIPASFVGISDLDSSPVLLTITDAVATSNRARQRKETLVIRTTMVVPIADAWED